MLIAYGIYEAVINYGGMSLALGSEKRMGIVNPLKQGEMIGSLIACHQAVVTSRLCEGNAPYMIDLKKGTPVKQGIASETIVSHSAMLADIFTTVLFNDPGFDLNNRLYIYNDGRCLM